MRFRKNILLAIIFYLLLFLLANPTYAKNLKIGLTITNDHIIIGSNKQGVILNLFNNQKIANIKKLESYIIRNANGLISILHKPTNTILGAFTGPIKLIPEKKEGYVSCNNKWYRGELIILTNSHKKNLTVVNNVNLEDYLLSVVPSEIPSKWHKEVLKAQAIAARSYALGYLGRRRGKGYDLESTVEDQVYWGISSEKRATSKAVKETEGIVVADKNNNPIIALYHSSGGGCTDSIENLWDEKPSVHIQPRVDYDDNSPHFKWSRKYNKTDVSKLLSNLNVGEVTNIIPLSRSISERIMWIDVIGTNGKVKIRGEEFRKYLKLPSSKFYINTEDNVIQFTGKGFGHGLGLSQWGAKALAERGFTYEQILTHYYPDVRIIKLYNNNHENH